ncbi:alpha-glucosidase [Protaetiibacter intestinalis]|uniref:Alpha-glucosidase n=1 Tax=Protaetiibacter intestinalis TaxID=2419774 RepID=A0A387B423_9MICO|nr:alpha-glucosidase [Protaetiibacter intestinalis]AYF98384.1 alpha-glucosidase [Protaetiibacter intestinalis]
MPEPAPITRRSRVRELYAHPLGRDIVDSLAHQVGRSPRWVDNPLVGALRLGALPRLSGGRLDDAFVDALVGLLAAVPDRPNPGPMPLREAWFKEAVFYQVYPCSFQDSDGDGIGDLRGILSRLDYLKGLGVDALWLSPIYDSPMDDMGYDIRDYRKVLAEFGTLDDLDALIAGLHERGMRLVMDLVVNHSSDEHAWFREALADPDSPYRDYYFLREGEPDTPPNNWRSFFSGPAWRWFPEAGVWGLHLFSSKQMDLNWGSERMRADVVDMVRWWRERGVDGFRLDVINLISKTPGLPDGNETIGALTGFTGLEHYFHGPRLHEHLRQLRAEAFDDPDCVAIGETPAIGAQMGKLMVGDDRGELDMVFNFEHLENPGRTRFDAYRYDLRHLKRYYTRWQADYGDGYWMSLFFDNHDNPRMVSKVDPRSEHRVAVAKLLATVMFTLRGTPFLYQGQELGAVDQRFVALDELRDVESLNLAAELAATGTPPDEVFARVLAGTRDHTRVPMAWDASGGFTTGVPWLAGDGGHAEINVASQEGDAASVLEWHRALIALRRDSPALVYGETLVERSGSRVWRYRRRRGAEEYLVVLNLGDRPARTAPPPAGAELLLASGSGTGSLAPYEARLWRLG